MKERREKKKGKKKKAKRRKKQRGMDFVKLELSLLNQLKFPYRE